MFNLDELKNQLPKDQVEKLTKDIKKEFPDDEMMFELHLMRALKTLIE